jgi:hypothetical protein
LQSISRGHFFDQHCFGHFMLLSSRGTQATELLVIGHECSATRT